MRKTTAAETRLRQAATIPDILAASFDAFEVTRLLARDSENAVPALFAAFMTTADAAVDGREAVTAAPSFPPGPSGQVGHDLPAVPDDGLATAIFLGLENINPESLMGAKKRQNKIWEYREMLLAWRAQKVMTYAGYILGFPTDTPESIARDIEIIKKELPVDILEFFYLTPLPGSEDHKNLFTRGVPMDPDMNKYDLEHACTAHPLMSKEIWMKVYADAWTRYYSDEHVETIMRRAVVSGINRTKILDSLTIFSGASRIEGVHPLQFGFLRRKLRTQRRYGMPLLNPLVFYPWRIVDFLKTSSQWLRLVWRYRRIMARVKADPASRTHFDEALRPHTAGGETDHFVEMFADKIPHTHGAPARASAAVG